jgi:hypothetical protein
MNTRDRIDTIPMEHTHPPLIGLANSMRMAFEGHSLMPLASAMLARAENDEQDANALMDLATLLQLQGLKEQGLATLSLALQIKRLYALPAKQTPTIHLLAIMAPGDLMANAPLPFLFENSDIALEMLYLMPGEPLPDQLPAHDVAFIAISDSSQMHDLLAQLSAKVGTWPRPVLIQPDCILRTSREQAFHLLKNAPGVTMPATAQTTRVALQQLCAGGCTLFDLLPDATFPLIIRPVDSHAGHGLAKVEDLNELTQYLADSIEADFFVSRFIDYRGPDGLFRKYRVVLINGVPFAGHMGVSEHWMIHYLNAGMAESAQKRAEEERFMLNFEADFAKRHEQGLRSVHERFGLEYLVMDCAEAPMGELLVFEVDPGAVVHSMDPQDLFPYKRPAMQKVFDAFRAMLQQTIAGQPRPLISP